MPEPIPDLSRDHQCFHYQAPSGQRCGSPALKGEYYCHHHLVKTNYKKNHRVLIDPGAPPEVNEETRPALPAPLAHPAIASDACVSGNKEAVIKEAVILNAVKDPCISSVAPPNNATPQPATRNCPAHSPGRRLEPRTRNLEPRPSNLAERLIHASSTAIGGKRPRNPHSSATLLYTLIGARYP